MKAIVQEGYGSPEVLRLREIDRPVPEDKQVLVRVRAASVNAADWHLMGRAAHVIGRLMRVPRSPVRGTDLAGQVEAVGGSVTRLKPGDEVFGMGIGAFAEYALTPEDRVVMKPANLTFEQAAAFPIAGLTALQGLRDTADLRPGQKVLIYGAGGGVGTFAVQIARSLGAHVTAVTGTSNVDRLRSIGADEIIDYTKEDFADRGPRYDVVFDIGADRSLADCRRALTPNGVLVLVGAPEGLWTVLWRLLGGRLLSRTRGKRIESFMARGKLDDLLVLKNLAEAGKLLPVIDRRYALSEVPDAIRYIGTRAARGKVVITLG